MVLVRVRVRGRVRVRVRVRVRAHLFLLQLHLQLQVAGKAVGHFTVKVGAAARASRLRLPNKSVQGMRSPSRASQGSRNYSHRLLLQVVRKPQPPKLCELSPNLLYGTSTRPREPSNGFKRLSPAMWNSRKMQLGHELWVRLGRSYRKASTTGVPCMWANIRPHCFLEPCCSQVKVAGRC